MSEKACGVLSVSDSQQPIMEWDSSYWYLLRHCQL